MPDSRPRALVTAPVRGPGLELLHELADLVIDPWIDQQPIRIYNAEQLAERAAAEGATILIVEADSCKGVVFEQPLIAVASCRGDPTNVDVAAATAAGVPVLRAPARNADAVAELAVALLLAVNRGVRPRRRRCPRRPDLPRRDHPLPTVPGLATGRAHGRDRRPRCRGARAEVAPRGPRHARRRRAIPTRPMPPTASTSFSRSPTSCPCTHPVTPETTGMIGKAQFAAMRDGVIFLNTARAQLHDGDALVEALAVGQGRRSGSRSLRGRASGHRPSPHDLRRTWCSPRTSAGPPTTPRPITRRPSPRICAGCAPASPPATS